MPPTTRRSQAGASQASIAKNPTRKRGPQATTSLRKESSSLWNFNTTSNGDEVLPSTEDQADDEDQNEEHPPLALGGSADALDSLHEMADKVGREVELFSVELDRFLRELPHREDKHVVAIEVAGKFQHIAQKAAESLNKRHERERRLQLRREWAQRANVSDQRTGGGSRMGSIRGTGSILEGRKAEEVKEQRHWQQEADIWQLFKLILELHYRHTTTEALDRELQAEREDKLAQMASPNRYTTEAELYERFLIESDTARERSLIKKWLEQTAEHQETDVQGVMEELETRSGAGKGLWSKGWLHTRERIKKEKRLRSWPDPSDPVLPQVRTENGEDMMATTLDPDAPGRQQRVLEKEDRFYEKAVWVACWEMLRRGTSWQDIRAWCEERNEGWRAVALFAMESKHSGSNSAWRKMCHLASESECANEYEAAVYGLLSGNSKAVERVCRSVDDHLFAYYTTTLTREFELYLHTNFSDRVPAMTALRRSTSANEDLTNRATAQEAFNNLIMRLRQNSATKEESAQPLKIIEHYLLNNDAENLVYTTGMAASDLDSMRGGEETESVIERIRKAPAQLLPESQVVLDPAALRIAAHIYVVTRAIDPMEPQAETVGAEENVLVSYLQALRAQGRRDYAAMYASRMRHDKYVAVLGNLLQDVSGASQQKEMLKLMSDDYGLDVVAIFDEQVRLILQKYFTLRRDQVPSRPLETLEDYAGEQTRLFPGRRIREDFMPAEMDEGDILLCRGLEWFRLLPGEWKVTFSTLGLGMRMALVSGHVSGAMLLARTFPFQSISEHKTVEVLGKVVNIMDKNSPIQPPPGTQEAVQLDVLRRQSRTYYELEQLVLAILALADWVSVERAYSSTPRAASTAPTELKIAKADLDEAVAPLLQPGFLREAADESEAVDLKWIRMCYIPEILLAYQCALYSAGPMISRDAYIELMDLSTTIADEDTGLTELFVQSGRMRELVDGFAQAGKMMLVMKGVNGKKFRPKGREGKDLSLWEIGGAGVTNGDGPDDVGRAAADADAD
ncbi:hypothetical protein KC320_g7399 [Hortaea werneckii]|nr:hypothetical protein KC320_g7399 [Hortaea werneckii]